MNLGKSLNLFFKSRLAELTMIGLIINENNVQGSSDLLLWDAYYRLIFGVALFPIEGGGPPRQQFIQAGVLQIGRLFGILNKRIISKSQASYSKPPSNWMRRPDSKNFKDTYNRSSWDRNSDSNHKESSDHKRPEGSHMFK